MYPTGKWKVPRHIEPALARHHHVKAPWIAVAYVNKKKRNACLTPGRNARAASNYSLMGSVAESKRQIKNVYSQVHKYWLIDTILIFLALYTTTMDLK